jgi:hypothetical protein
MGMGNGEWGMGNGDPLLIIPLPTPYSLLPISYSRRLAQLHGLITSCRFVLEPP